MKERMLDATKRDRDHAGNRDGDAVNIDPGLLAIAVLLSLQSQEQDGIRHGVCI